MAKTVLLTGANGFVGSHVADALLARGDRVRAMVRVTSNLRWLENKSVDRTYASLEDYHSLCRALEGVDAVIHNAGVVSAPNKYLYFFNNTDGTRRLIEAVLESAPDISRFVYVSSQAAGGPTLDEEPRRESDPPNPITAYGESKLLAENHLKKYMDRIPISIVRPSPIYGPRDTGFLPYFKLISRGLLPLFGSGRELSLTHTQDLARQILVQLDNEEAVGEVFHAAPFDPVSLEEFTSTITRVLGGSPLVVNLPDTLIRYGFPLAYPLIRLLGIKPPFRVDKLPDILNPRWTISGDKAREMLGFEGVLPLLAGVGQTVEWYRWKKWVMTRRDRARSKGAVKPHLRMQGGRKRVYDPTCDLCALGFDGELKTVKHYEDDDLVIVDCLICRVPMAVLKEHRSLFSAEEKQRLLKIFRERFGEESHPDFEQRRIPAHAHVHYRNVPHTLPWERRPE